MNVILLNSRNVHISATHVGIFRVIRTRLKTQLWCVEIALQFKIIKFLSKIQCCNSKIPMNVIY